VVAVVMMMWQLMGVGIGAVGYGKKDFEVFEMLISHIVNF